MANIKSAKKRILVSQKRALINKSIRSRVKTYTKRVETAIDSGEQDLAKEALKQAVSEIAKASSKGVYHKNTSARKISRLTKAVNAIAS